MSSRLDGSPGASPPPKVEVVVSTRTVVRALLVLFFLVLVVVAKDAILSVFLAVIFVLGLDAPVAKLEKRGIGRGKAALLVFAVMLLALALIAVVAGGPLWDSFQDFMDQVPGWIDELKEAPVIKELEQDTGAMSDLKAGAVDAAKSLAGNAVALLGAIGGAVASVFTLVTLAFLTLFGLIGRPQLSQAAFDLMPPNDAKRAERTLGEVMETVYAALIGNVVISVIAGTVVGVTAVIVGAPSPAVLAVIVGLFDLIPQVGSTIAAFIVVLVTLIATGPGPALILLVVILVYQQVENYVIQPAVMHEAVALSGFATIAVVLVGSALLGVVGAILAVPVAASVKVILRELSTERRERMAALREAAGPADDAPVPAGAAADA